MKNRGKLKLLFLFSILLVVLLSSCGKITKPKVNESPYNMTIDKLYQNRIEISWEYNNADRDTIEYHLYKQVANNFYDIEDWQLLSVLTEDVTSYQDNINTSDTLLYSYKVKVYKENKDLFSDFSDVVAYFSSYTNPTDLQATQIADDKIELSWKDNVVGEDGYAIKKKVGNGDWFVLTQSASNPYIDTVDLFENISYKIYAYKGISTSASVECNIEPTLMKPDSLVLQKYEDAKIRLNWQDNSDGEDGFTIEKKIGNLEWDTSYAVVDSNITSYIDDNNLTAATISYRIRATKGNNSSACSNESTINILLSLIGEISTPGEAKDLSIQGNDIGVYAYIADMFEGLEVVDCSHPNALESKTFNQGITDRIYSVDAKDNVCYFTIHDDPYYDSGFGMVDLSDINTGGFSELDTLFVIGYSPVPDIPYDVATKGTYSYIASGENGLVTMISQGPPHVITTTSTNGDARKCIIDNNTLYVANGLNNGIAIFDISNPIAPVLLSNLVLNGFAKDIVAKDGYVYLANAEDGFVIIDATDPSTPIVHSRINTNGFVSSVTVRDNFAYFTDHNNGFYIINIEDKSNPYIQGKVEMTTEPSLVQVYGSYAYILDNSGLKIIQIDK